MDGLPHIQHTLQLHGKHDVVATKVTPVKYKKLKYIPMSIVRCPLENIYFMWTFYF